MKKLNNPSYSTLIMLFSTCFSRYAIDAFASRDSPQKRILIAIADYDEVSWWIDFPGATGMIFTHHFTNNFKGDYFDAYWFTFIQCMYSYPYLAWYLISSGWLSYILFRAGNEYGFYVFLGVLLGLLLVAVEFGDLAARLSVLSSYYNNTYISYRYAYPFTVYGAFFGLYLSSHPPLYNIGLAEVTGL